jgi:hypothetical protein
MAKVGQVYPFEDRNGSSRSWPGSHLQSYEEKFLDRVNYYGQMVRWTVGQVADAAIAAGIGADQGRSGRDRQSPPISWFATWKRIARRSRSNRSPEDEALGDLGI